MTATLSLGEIEALAYKAARGAGLDWGLAEEAGVATRWLVGAGIDGTALLARLLDNRQPGAVSLGSPVLTGRDWTSGDAAALCPIAVGAALSDHFSLPEGPLNGPIRLRNLCAPALILPFLAWAGARAGAVVAVQWSDLNVILAAASLVDLTGPADLIDDLVPEVTVSARPAMTVAGVARPRLADSPAARTSLEAQASRTLVPASDQSRRGAGGLGIDDP